jgi:Flp pilus assembly protein TadD
MQRWSWLVIALLVASAAVDADDRYDRDGAEAQVEFGIEVAKHGLWQEAAYRFRRAAQLDPTYAEAFNNLGIACEQLGQLDEARRMYEQAVALEPDDSFILDNYNRFRELDDRRVRPLARAAASPPSPPGW